MKTFKNYSDHEILIMTQISVREADLNAYEYENGNNVCRRFLKKWLDYSILKFIILISECERRGIEYSNYITIV